MDLGLFIIIRHTIMHFSRLYRYHVALRHSGLLTLTTPYLDSGGAGEVITAARALFHGESSHVHRAYDEALGVMGADFPLRYFYR